VVIIHDKRKEVTQEKQVLVKRVLFMALCILQLCEGLGRRGIGAIFAAVEVRLLDKTGNRRATA